MLQLRVFVLLPLFYFIMNYLNDIDFKKLKIANYCRKSSEAEERQMLSLGSQKDEAKRIVDYYKLPEFVRVFEESKSAKKEFERESFSEMMKMIECGKIDCIVCWKLDRLARNMTEGGRIIDLLSSGILKAVITHDKVWYPSDNVIMMSLEFGQGKQFSKDLSINVKRGQRKKAQMGVPHGVATLGFKNDKSEEKGNRRWLVDKDRLKSVKILLEMFLTGTYSAGKLHRYAVKELKLTTVRHKKSGGCLIAKSRMYEILRDPTYAGFFYYGGERYEFDSKLPRIITEEQHEKIKMFLVKKNISKFKTHKTAYSGFLVSDENKFMGQDVKYQLICDCKHKFAYLGKTHCPKCGKEIEQLDNPKYLNYVYYYNVSKKKYRLKYKSISERILEKKLIKFADENLTFSNDLSTWVRKHIEEMKDKEINDNLFKKEKQLLDQKGFESKKSRLRQMLRDEMITEKEYKKDLEDLNKQYSINSHQDNSSFWFNRLNEIVNLSDNLKEILEKGSVQEKKETLSVLGSNLVWDDKNLFISNDSGVNELVKGFKGIRSRNPEFEPKNCVVNKGLNRKTEAFSPVFSRMLRRQDSNLRQIDYTYPKISLRGGLYHHPSEPFKLGCEALPIYLKKINSTP